MTDLNKVVWIGFFQIVATGEVTSNSRRWREFFEVYMLLCDGCFLQLSQSSQNFRFKMRIQRILRPTQEGDCT